MFDKIMKRIESRRQFNRTKQFLANRAYSRCMVHLKNTGAIR